MLGKFLGLLSADSCVMVLLAWILLVEWPNEGELRQSDPRGDS
jgi:hypothetical protein